MLVLSVAGPDLQSGRSSPSIAKQVDDYDGDFEPVDSTIQRNSIPKLTYKRRALISRPSGAATGAATTEQLLLGVL